MSHIGGPDLDKAMRDVLGLVLRSGPEEDERFYRDLRKQEAGRVRRLPDRERRQKMDWLNRWIRNDRRQNLELRELARTATGRTSSGEGSR